MKIIVSFCKFRGVYSQSPITYDIVTGSISSRKIRVSFLFCLGTEIIPNCIKKYGTEILPTAEN